MTTPYKPQGIIRQLPAIKPTYRGKNPAKGRKIPTNYIGAAIHQHTKDPWKQRLENTNDISMHFQIGCGIIIMTLNKYS